MHIFSNVEAPEKNINLEVTADDLYGIHYEDRWTDWCIGKCSIKRTTKLIHGVLNWNRCKESMIMIRLKLPTLLFHRYSGDIIETFKILTQETHNILSSSLFILIWHSESQLNQTRRHQIKTEEKILHEAG